MDNIPTNEAEKSMLFRTNLAESITVGEVNLVIKELHLEKELSDYPRNHLENFTDKLQKKIIDHGFLTYLVMANLRLLFDEDEVKQEYVAVRNK